MKADRLKRLRELEKENQRLRKAVSDLTLDELILSEAVCVDTERDRQRPRRHRLSPA